MWHLDEGTIHAWLDGALSADEARRVEAHVGSCTVCADAVAEARGLIAASSRILTALDDVPYVRGAEGAIGAGGAKGERRSLTTWLVRERLAAVVALVIAGGALAVVLNRDTATPTSIPTASEAVEAFELAAADSPALPPSAPASGASRREAERTTRAEVPRVTSPAPARDLAAASRADSALAADRDLSRAAVADVSIGRAQARTVDTARQLALAEEIRREASPTAQAAAAEGKAAIAGNIANRAPGRGAEVDASARFAQPPAAEVRLRGLANAKAVAPGAQLLQDERMMESGREVHRRIYRVEGILVTLDERVADTRELELEQRRAAASAEANAPRAVPVPAQDSATASTNTIRWTDSRGTEFVLSGQTSPAKLAEIRKLLGY